jgi:TM2 domain-containing membrane protein YozV
MNGLAIFLNLFIPGVGCFVVGKPGQGIAQIFIWGFGLMLTLTGLLAVFGVPLMIGAWIWGLVTASTAGASKPQQVHVNVIQQTGSTNSTSSTHPEQDRR